MTKTCTQLSGPRPTSQPPKPQHQKNTSIHFYKDNWILGKSIVQAALTN